MLSLTRLMAGQYQTKDGRFNVEFDSRLLPGECQCVVCENGGYNCPHDGFGRYEFWHIWDNNQNDYLLGTGPEMFDTLKEAREYLEYELNAQEKTVQA